MVKHYVKVNNVILGQKASTISISWNSLIKGGVVRSNKLATMATIASMHMYGFSLQPRLCSTGGRPAKITRTKPLATHDSSAHIVRTVLNHTSLRS